MIEIRVDEDDRPITPDGPHSPERTRAVAEAIGAAFRLLNYATMSTRGLRWPADVYSVLGELAAAIDKLPQALRQMTEFIGDQVAQGRATENPSYGTHSGDAEAAHVDMAAAIQEATNDAANLAGWLRRAQSAVRGLEAIPGEEWDVQ
jgi:hypothetical protein